MVSMLRPRGLTISTLRPVLRNKSGSLNFRHTADVHINQVVFQPPVKPFQIQGPVYKKQVENQDIRASSQPSLEKLWDQSGTVTARSMHPPTTAFQASWADSLLLAFSLLPSSPALSAWKEKGAQNKQCKGPLQKLHHHHSTDTPEAAVKDCVCFWKENGVRRQRPFNLTSLGPWKTCQVLFQQNLSFVRSCGTKTKISATWEAEAKRLQV